jgi:hypothetical protein
MAYRGVSAEQAPKYKDKLKTLLKTQKFPSILSTPLAVKKVNLDVLRPWVSEKITTILGFDDEVRMLTQVVTEFIFGLLETEKDGRIIQIELTGFLEDKTAAFMKELW